MHKSYRFYDLLRSSFLFKNFKRNKNSIKWYFSFVIEHRTVIFFVVKYNMKLVAVVTD